MRWIWRILAVGGILITAATARGAQERSEAETARGPLPHGILLMASAGGGETSHRTKDPGYGAYKEGYASILEAQWEHACRKFDDLLSKYSRSDYCDDALYWKAYALSQTNRTKAIEAYVRLINTYPQSIYIDDVISDLKSLDPTTIVVRPGKRRSISIVLPRPRSSSAASEGAYIRARRRSAASEHIRIVLPRSGATSKQEVDPDTRLRLDALYALGKNATDDTSFSRMKDIARDRSQRVQVRQAAIEMLAGFKGRDATPVLVDLARADTNEAVRSIAIEFISVASSNKEKTVETLITLFNSLPEGRKEAAETVLYVLAEVGSDSAIGFLASLARTHHDVDLRSNAIYYLGTIGGEKARSALYEILRSR